MGLPGLLTGPNPVSKKAHTSHDESSRNRESCAITLGPRGHGAGDGGDVAQIVRPPRWKTKICYKWETTKYCRSGTDCSFAHGAAELHRFGGGLVQGEGTIGTSSTPETKQTGQAEKVTSFVSPGVPSQQASNAVTQNPKGVRIRGKWKGPDKLNKINRIYGDWIEDPRKGV